MEVRKTIVGMIISRSTERETLPRTLFRLVSRVRPGVGQGVQSASAAVVHVLCEVSPGSSYRRELLGFLLGVEYAFMATLLVRYTSASAAILAGASTKIRVVDSTSSTLSPTVSIGLCLPT